MNPEQPDQNRDPRTGRDRDLDANNPWPSSMKRACVRHTPSLPNLVGTDHEVPISEVVSALSSRYEILKPIDRGRGAVAYRARSSNPDRELWLRLIRPSLSTARFMEVIAALKQIRSRHVATVYDGELLPDGTAVVVMDWIDGTDLKAKMAASGGPIPEATVLPWMEQICEGMTVVAAQNIVHCNLKPANIVFDQAQSAYVNDFGLATFSDEANVGPVGTPSYMPPEQMQHPYRVDSRSDIYSFGATFYHALMGKSHFEARDLKLKRFDGVPAPQTLSPNLSESTARLLLRCLETAPGNRFQTFVELRTCLERRSTPIEVRRPLPQPPSVPGFTILSELGRGGMGVVYKAFEGDSDRFVALKFIRAIGRANLDQLARFRIEAEAVACLRHPNIVPVLKMGVVAGVPYVVLEYVGGGNLKSQIDAGLVNPVRAAKIAAGVARGLSHSHGCAIIHRDLKPQNVLLTPEDIPRITDFGLAKFTVSGEGRAKLRSASILPEIAESLFELAQFGTEGERMADAVQDQIAETVEFVWRDIGQDTTRTITLDQVRQFVTETVRQRQAGMYRGALFDDHDPTRFGEIVGTPAYMAPEQTTGDPTKLGRHTDIYALGVILYEMLSGHPPHAADSLAELFKQIRYHSPAPVNRSVPPTLQRICMKCLAKEPGDRYHSAADVASALQQFIDLEGNDLADRGVRLADGRDSRKPWWHFWP